MYVHVAAGGGGWCVGDTVYMYVHVAAGGCGWCGGDTV
jgi:hypothetical protein